jgi:uncharacterized protein (TIGR00369 family)
LMREKQPNSKHCFVCGLENPRGLQLTFYQTGPAEVTADYTVKEGYQGYPGVVHGGIVASMLDEMAGRALMGVDPQQSRFFATARLDIQYRKPVPVGEPLRLVGRATKLKERSAAAHAAIYGPGGDLLAEADAILVDVPASRLEGDLVALGWRVYPDEVPEESEP